VGYHGPEKTLPQRPCPCGSGKKYKHCCWHKGFAWEEDEDGAIYKSTPISPEVKEVLRGQRQKFFMIVLLVHRVSLLC
jgi:hypothetical protein